MKLPTAGFELPLLARDLDQQAHSKWTYRVRVFGSIGLYAYSLAIGLYANIAFVGNSNNLFWYLGRGREVLNSLVSAELFGIYLLIPAWMCGAVAAEKERQTLPLLLVTRLGVWRILLEKFTAPMFRVLILLCLSIPLLAAAYPLGGFSEVDLARALWTVVVCSLYVGAVTLFCSCWFPTTASAYLGSCALLAFLSFGPMIGFYYLGDKSFLVRWLNSQFPPIGRYILFPPMLHLLSTRFLKGNFTAVVPKLLYLSLPTLAQTLFFLLLARWIFLSRVLHPGAPLLTRLRQWEAHLPTLPFRRKRSARTDLPDLHPIAWRESRSNWLLKSAWIIAAILGCFVKSTQMAKFGFPHEAEFVYLTFFEISAALLWMISLATGIILRERSRQTLDVLLASPLPSDDFLNQKLHRAFVVWRWFALYMAVSSLLNFLVGRHQFLTDIVGRKKMFDPCPVETRLMYVVNILTFVGLYLPASFWLALAVSLRARTQGRAIVTSVVSVIAWMILPMIVFGVFASILRANGDHPYRLGYCILGIFSPLGLFVADIDLLWHFHEKKSYILLPYLSLLYPTHIAIFYFFRRSVLRAAKRNLARLEPVPDADSTDPLPVSLPLGSPV